MLCLLQDNVNHQMCHINMSLKAQTHINTIHKVWVTTPHGASQQFGMLIFVREMTSAPPPDHLTITGALEESKSGLALRNQELTWRAPKE
ncbi:hypothetical protein O181_023197 [Austropuccinia psidii MF-1]|uniref:Uncharacterized protein n=1 Tax=Austropuccinia psidii MF-1 TaxID=1389203 RepID=A0A9Q3CJ21_9BASI|nr:hypothetical protein [Austropuccinia psidii MF-1]